MAPASERGASLILTRPFLQWMARVALLAYALQLSSLGHWSIGPYQPLASDPATHADHCHGDTSACSGQPALSGTYLEQPLTLSRPVATFVLPLDSPEAPREAHLPLPDKPPRLG